jgi:S-adenosylmethionine:tRNA ribosyltransferase-isomerase
MIPSINIDDYTYELPDDRIARYPLQERDLSKLLVYDRGVITERVFREFPGFLTGEDLLVFNDTRVVQARLRFTRQTGSRIEVFCLEPYDPSDYSLAFQKTSGSVWKCLVGNAKKWKENYLELEIGYKDRQIRLRAEKTGRDKDAFLVRFTWSPEEVKFGDILDLAGKTPIPPYLGREAEPGDKGTYQTVYSRVEGSVAAPTAGLHFTDPVLSEIRKRKVPMLHLTLHIGAGTFKPVSTERLEDHPMHAEHFHIPRTALERLYNHQGRIVAVGTTSTRILESLYWQGSKKDFPDAGYPVFLDQWDAYHLPGGEVVRNLGNLLEYMDNAGLETLTGITRLMIVPGYRFRMVNRLVTNYHQPNSTLLLLVAAFIGEDWKKVYDFALEKDFRFLSYGDSSLLIP